MSHGCWRVPGATEMHVFKAEIGGDKKLISGLEAKNGTVIADAGFRGAIHDAAAIRRICRIKLLSLIIRIQ